MKIKIRFYLYFFHKVVWSLMKLRQRQIFRMNRIVVGLVVVVNHVNTARVSIVSNCFFHT